MGLRAPVGLAVDSDLQHVYWTDTGGRAIGRCDVDGGCVERIVVGHRWQDNPFGLAVDSSTDTIMWSTAGSSAIRRANLNGEHVHIISEGGQNSWSATGPWGIAMHLRPGCASARGSNKRTGAFAEQGLGRIFWTSWGRIQCCELANGKVRDVVTGLVDPTGLAIDPRFPGGRLFWTDSRAGKVQCATLEGHHICDVATGLEEPWGIAIGPTHAFWTDRRRGAIQSCCLRTGNVFDVLTDVPSPEGVALLNVPVPVKSNQPTASTRQRESPSSHRSPVSQSEKRLFSLGSMASVAHQPEQAPKHGHSSATASADGEGNLMGSKHETDSLSSPKDVTLTVQDIMRLSERALAELKHDI